MSWWFVSVFVGGLAPLPLVVRARQVVARVVFALLSLFAAPLRQGPRGGWPPPRRILVLKPCCMGDVVFATPLLAALKAAYPASHLTVATSDWCARVLAHNPHVDAILDVPAQIGVRDLSSVARTLRAGGYDLALVPDRSVLLGFVVWQAGIPRRAGLDSNRRGFLYTDRVGVNPDDFTRHEVALYGAVGAAVGAPLLPGRGKEYHPAPAALAAADARIAAQGWEGPLWAVHPGGGVNPGATFTPKRWPPERFAALADGLLHDHGGTVLLLGTAAEAEVTAAVRGAMRGPTENAIDLAGTLDFEAWHALAHRAALYIGADTGNTHIAHAGGTPTVAIFGPTSPAQYGLWGGVGAMAVGRVPWSPCLRNGQFRCACGTIRCMDVVTVEAVRAAIEQTLARSRGTTVGTA